jgi:outer membrane receptor protein involved in Fe transport
MKALKAVLGRSTRSFALHKSPDASDASEPSKPLIELVEKMKSTAIVASILAIVGWASSATLSAQTSPEKEASVDSQASSKPSTEVVQLTPFTVSASGDTGYGAIMGSSGRLATPYIDMPQSTSIVTSELLNDANLFDSKAATKFVPNVQENGYGSANSSFMIRGLLTTTTYVDGFPITSGSVIDTAFADRIEVVKGPSSAGFGRGDPAGFINYVTKSPLFTHSTETSVTAGTGGPRDNLRFTFDNNGFVTSDGKTAYRLTTLYTSGSETQDLSQFERSGAQLSVDRLLGQRGDIKITTSLSRNHFPYDVTEYEWWDPTARFANRVITGNTVEAGVPLLDSNYVFPVDGAERLLSEAFNSNVVLNWKLSDHWSTRQAVNYYNFMSAGNRTITEPDVVYQDANGDIVMNAFIFQTKNADKDSSYQSDFVGQYESDFWRSKYTLLFGGDIANQSSLSASQFALYPAAPVLNWNSHLPYSFSGDIDKVGLLTTGTQWSPYAQAGATFLDNMIQPTVSVRKLYYDNQTLSQADGSITYNKNSTPLFATYSLLVKPRKWLSVYALSSKYEEPPVVSLKWRGVQNSDPRFTEQITSQPKTKVDEIGIKGSLMNDRLTFSISTFKVQSSGSIRSAYVPEKDANGATSIPVFDSFLSKDSVDGWEFEMFGQPTKHLTFMTGGGFMSSEENRPRAYFDPSAPPIVKIRNSQGNSLFANVKYAFGTSASNGLTIRAGVKCYFSGWTLSRGPSPAYPDPIQYPKDNIETDLGLSYGFGHGHYSAGLSVNNAFHAKPSGIVSYANAESGRRVFVNFDAKF